ncbi:MAG TPA: AvrD family protein [Nocardia sp.]|uniref:AvrD family protein n=1 Tax=Nocardia TaxID=1817 RepID=UPI0024577372|nr:MULTISPECIES: AvrD family protein [Nocardia]HLS75993.1 AvrD family protein [Nocardia sp.]
MSVVFSSYDEPLGPRATRYFGEGYRKVGPELSALVLDNFVRPGARHSARARLEYPADWSKKKHRELVPHVSSVDTVMLAATLCDAAITRARALSPEQSARTWVRHGAVRAGAAPHEDLDDIPVTAEVTGLAEDGDLAETTFKFQVGNLAGTLTLVHEIGAGSGPEFPGTDTFDSLADIFGPAPHYYLTGVKDHSLSAHALRVDADATRVTGRQSVRPGAENGYVGAEAAYWDSVSPIDAIVGAAQLSQILLYQMDSLDRTNSDTLWMRKLEFFAEQPPRPSAEEFDGTVEIKRASVIDRGGQRWRSADLLIKEFQGVTGSCLLAHRLPE